MQTLVGEHRGIHGILLQLHRFSSTEAISQRTSPSNRRQQTLQPLHIYMNLYE